jgi:hypothetical protein
LYAQLKELRKELARYEGGAQPVTATSSPAQTYKLPPEPLTMAQSTQAMLAKINMKKMPWDG